MFRFSSCKPGEVQSADSAGSTCSDLEATPSPHPSSPVPALEPLDQSGVSVSVKNEASDIDNVTTTTTTTTQSDQVPGDAGTQIGN